MYRYSHFRGAAIMGALSAIDIALWDIKGKYYNAPIWQLLGGKCRDKVRVYAHVNGCTVEEQVEHCLKAKEEGYTAVGHINTFLLPHSRYRTRPTEGQKRSRMTVKKNPVPIKQNMGIP